MKNFNSANALKSLESLATKVESLRVSYEEAESIDKIPYDNLSYTDVEPFLVRFDRHLKMVESLLETIQEDLDDAVSLLDDFEPLEELKIDFSLNTLLDSELKILDYLWSIRKNEVTDECWDEDNLQLVYDNIQNQYGKIKSAKFFRAVNKILSGLSEFPKPWHFAKAVAQEMKNGKPSPRGLMD